MRECGKETWQVCSIVSFDLLFRPTTDLPEDRWKQAASVDLGLGTSLCGCWTCWMMSSVWKEGKTGLSRKISIPFCKGGVILRVDAFQSQQSRCCTMCYWRHAALCFLWWGEHPDLHRLHLYSTTKAGLGRIIGFFSMLLWRWRWATLVERGSAGMSERSWSSLILSSVCTYINTEMPLFVFTQQWWLFFSGCKYDFGLFSSHIYKGIFLKWIIGTCSGKWFSPKHNFYNQKNNKNLVQGW